MKIHLPRSGDSRWELHLEQRFVSPDPVISLGSDCLPATILDTLHLRTQSFPFDWLGTPGHLGIDYVTRNVKGQFRDFLRNLHRNEQGQIIAKAFPQTQFAHFHDLIRNRARRALLMRRAQRFLEFFHTRPCSFLYCLPNLYLNTRERADFFIRSVDEFSDLSNGRHGLHVILRFDEVTDRPETPMKYLKETLQGRSDINIKVAKFVGHWQRTGIYGEPKEYPSLLKNLDVEIRRGFPVISLLKIRKPTSS